MKKYFIHNLLQKDGWRKNVLIEVDELGSIKAVTPDSEKQGIEVKGYALPGFQNAHSHGFQFAMAGLAEIHKASHTSDDFWSWREAMYQLALSVSPEQMESIATMLYSEMVRHGYTNVAEFHYVHHDQNGKPYEHLSEMGLRMISAAEKAGINITLVPIFYQKGGFGKKPTEGQRRFISPDANSYLRLLESSKKDCDKYHHANIGIGIHSMRGVDPTVISDIASNGPQDIPFHIHIAEQLKEIEDCVEFLGQRPVEWLLDNVPLNERYHLVHATHLTEAETKGIANSGANVVLCPTTEGNLGDGLFPVKQFQEHGGNWSIGTDSHVGINPLEELRLLDYGQRLVSHKRNTFTSTNEGNSGDYALRMATFNGRKAMNDFSSEFFEVGQQFNAAVFSENAPLLRTASDEKLTSAIVYTCDASHHSATIVNGVIVMENGIHLKSDEISESFVATMNELGSRV